MTSGDMKNSLVDYLNYRKQFPCVATEFINGSDVFGVNRNDFATEIEIKVSWKDLWSELKTIKYILDEESDMSFGHYRNEKTGNWVFRHKFDKHRSYLYEEAKNYPRPKMFYFAVPLSLGTKALTALQTMECPYGVILVQEDRSWWDRCSVIREAKPLTKNKFTDYKYFANKTTNENLALRKKIVELSSTNTHENSQI